MKLSQKLGKEGYNCEVCVCSLELESLLCSLIFSCQHCGLRVALIFKYNTYLIMLLSTDIFSRQIWLSYFKNIYKTRG